MIEKDRFWFRFSFFLKTIVWNKIQSTDPGGGRGYADCPPPFGKKKVKPLLNKFVYTPLAAYTEHRCMYNWIKDVAEWLNFLELSSTSINSCPRPLSCIILWTEVSSTQWTLLSSTPLYYCPSFINLAEDIELECNILKMCSKLSYFIHLRFNKQLKENNKI